MEVSLIVQGGKNAGQEIKIRGPKFFIGRAEDCHLRPRTELVSRHHCGILVEEGFVAVRDFGSRNGTYVNDQRVKDEQELKTGDRLKVGSLEFEIRLAGVEAGEKTPTVHSQQADTVETVKAAADDDLDLSSWFDEDKDAGEIASADTQTIDATEMLGSEAANGDRTEEPSPAEQSDSSVPTAEEEKEPDPKEQAGIVGASKKTQEAARAASSQTAAADMLKKMAKRR